MISVIVPVYNVEQYLDRCIESIVNQSYNDLEIILVDDGSTDNSNIKCDEWRKRDKRIKVIHKSNGGLSEARNFGIDIATGEYIGFIDSDDWIDRDMYLDLFNAINVYKTNIAVTGMCRFYDNGYKKQQFVFNQPILIQGEEIVKKYLTQGTISTAACDKLYERELFSRRRFPVGKLYEDAPIIFDILCSVKKIIVVGKPQYYYFQRADSICGQEFSKKKLDHYYLSKEIWEKARREYHELQTEADIFWGCKNVELVYSLYESKNYSMFSNEKEMFLGNIDSMWWKIVRCPDVSAQMRVKTLLAKCRLMKPYLNIKAFFVRRSQYASSKD